MCGAKMDELFKRLSQIYTQDDSDQDKDDIERIANSIRYACRMPPDFAAVLLKGYMYIEKDFKEKLIMIPEFSKWLKTNGRLMNASIS